MISTHKGDVQFFFSNQKGLYRLFYPRRKSFCQHKRVQELTQLNKNRSDISKYVYFDASKLLVQSFDTFVYTQTSRADENSSLCTDLKKIRRKKHN